jgi:hypothetical protein
MQHFCRIAAPLARCYLRLLSGWLDVMTSAILKDEEAERRRELLVQLQAALGDLGIRAVCARNHHLGLPTQFAPVSGKSGQKPPVLYVFTGRDGMLQVQVNDGSYALPTGQSYPVSDAKKAAQEISHLVKA